MYSTLKFIHSRFRWPCCLRHRSAAAPLLGSLLSLALVVCCLDRDLCDGPITRAGESICNQVHQ